jgi:hypothetical protein
MTLGWLGVQCGTVPLVGSAGPFDGTNISDSL